MAEHQIPVAHPLNAIATDIQVTGAAHLPGELKAAARDACDIGRGPADAIGGRRHFRQHRITNRRRRKTSAEVGSLVALELDRDPEQAFAAHVAPMLEAVLRAERIGGESQHFKIIRYVGGEIAMRRIERVIVLQLVISPRSLL
ncbi:hypothetical protein [Bradyrhizobium tropiciagri]|uniref:hypothetical protein n=1 Tax=Bradyrhizobium tropiciagri TaxID=312253 RepID=UPI003D9BDD02